MKIAEEEKRLQENEKKRLNEHEAEKQLELEKQQKNEQEMKQKETEMRRLGAAIKLQTWWRSKHQRKIYLRKRKLLIKLQAIAKGKVVRNRMLLWRKKTQVAMEILETERSYVNCLGIIFNSFLTPLRVDSTLDDLEINKQIIKTTFSEIEV